MNVQDIPQDLKYAAIQHQIDHMKAQFAKNEEVARGLDQIRENYEKEINKLLGPKATEYSKFYEKRNEAARAAAPRFTATPEGEKAEREFKKTRLAEGDEFFKNLGIDVNDIKSIRKKYSEESISLTKKVRKLGKYEGV
jgi:hypothetical protein